MTDELAKGMYYVLIAIWINTFLSMLVLMSIERKYRKENP